MRRTSSLSLLGTRGENPLRLIRFPLATFVRRFNIVLVCGLAAYFLLAPGLLIIRHLCDPNLGGPGIPAIAWKMHRYLTPRYERWARARIASGKAAHLALHDVPSTEWPIFGSVYYLWATESLQKAWEKDQSLSPVAPKVYARETIEACKDLVLDPVHHTWVREHWGDNYLHTNNVFFRSLIIAALTSYEALAGGGEHLEMLKDQVESLSGELDASPCGLLEDYPRECYPVDVFASIALIRRADRVLGTDHGAFVAKAARAFRGDMLDRWELIPYVVDWRTGLPHDVSRGVGNSYILIFAPEIYPDLARTWYARYEQHFWQEKLLSAGFREYPRDLPGHEWDYDVDAGPILGGFSPAANAFGVAAAKVNGRLDHAYTLAAQVLAASWPLPSGRLLGASILSSAVHAPYLGETCLLFFLSQTPASGVEIRAGGRVPGFVYGWLVFYFGSSLLVFLAGWGAWRRWNRTRSSATVRAETAQVLTWLILMASAAALAALGHLGWGAVAAGLAFFVPRTT